MWPRSEQKRTRSQHKSATKTPEAKRSRLFRRVSGGARKSLSETGTVAMVSVSLQQPKPLQTLDNNTQLVLSTNDGSKKPSVVKSILPATSDNIESALCIISDTKNKYTRHEIVQALRDLRRWSQSETDRCSFCNELLDLGGIPRFLKFLTSTEAVADTEYVCLVSSIISSCTFIRNTTTEQHGYGESRDNNRSDEIGEKIARKCIDRGGIQAMLGANHKIYRGGSDVRTLKALDCIWAGIGNILSRKAVLDDMKKAQTLRIFNDAIATLCLIKETTTDATWVPRILVKIFSVLAYLSSCSPDASLVASDCKGKEVFQTCVQAVTSSNKESGYDGKVWSTVSRFFINCYNRLFFAINGYDDLVKIVIPFYVEYIKIAPNEAFDEGAFGFLCSAGEVIGKSLLGEIPDMMTTVGNVMDSRNNDEIKRLTKFEARKLLKYLL